MNEDLRNALSLAAVSVASVALVAVGLEALFARGEDNQWGEAVTAALTLVLVATTAVYAYFTQRLVGEARASRSDAAVSPVQQFLWNEIFRLGTKIKTAYPLTSHDPDARMVAELLQMLQGLVTLQLTLGGYLAGLPESVKVRVLDLLQAASDAAERGLLVVLSMMFAWGVELPGGPRLLFSATPESFDRVMEALLDMDELAADISWTDCKVAYNTAIRTVDGPPWEELVSAEAVSDFESARLALLRTLR